MDHEPVLISTIAVGLSAAFLGGLLARRLRLPAIVGYIVAGIAVGPFTPGFIADQAIATELAELGVILLMFGVGIHFSIRDLLAVRAIALPGAIGQITVATVLGVVLGLALGWDIGGGLVLGLALSVASTVVLLRALMDRGELDSQQGRIAVGWLIVEDLFTVVVLVLLPTLAPLLGGTGSEAGPGDRRARAVRRHRAGPGQGRRLRCADDRGRGAPGAVAAGRRGPRRVARAVHAGRAGHRPGHRLRRLGGVRRVVRAGRVPGRRGGRRVGHEPPGRGRRAAPARRLRGPVLRVGRDAPGPGRAAGGAAGGGGRGAAGGGRQVGRGLRHRGRLRLSDRGSG